MDVECYVFFKGIPVEPLDHFLFGLFVSQIPRDNGVMHLKHGIFLQHPGNYELLVVTGPVLLQTLYEQQPLVHGKHIPQDPIVTASWAFANNFFTAGFLTCQFCLQYRADVRVKLKSLKFHRSPAIDPRRVRVLSRRSLNVILLIWWSGPWFCFFLYFSSHPSLRLCVFRPSSTAVLLPLLLNPREISLVPS